MTKPSMCFLTLNSPLEGVGRSQVLPMLEQVSRRGWDCTLVSFRKDSEPIHLPPSGLGTESSSLRHVSLDFGATGPRAGLARMARLARCLPSADVYHCRDVLAFSAAQLRGRSPLIWDVRSLWAEQRVAAGTLARSSAAFRTLNILERRASRTATGMVSLTEAAAEELRRRHGRVPRYRRVIPTVADLDHFRPSAMPPLAKLRACLSGTFGANYDMGLAGAFIAALADVTGAPVGTTWTAGPGAVPLPEGVVPGELIRLATDYAELPEVISACHFGLVPIRLDTGVSASAMMPTKVGEFWASGRPIVVTRGVGDLDGIIERNRVGVILDAEDYAQMRIRSRELVELLREPDVSERCRRVAEEHFDLARGADDLVSLYESVSREGRSRSREVRQPLPH